MNSLSAAASITAVIQITFSIASVLEGYYEAVKDARARYPGTLSIRR
jgi:hypothetical protein